MAKEESSMNIEENVASLLCYLAWWVTGILFFAMENKNKTVRFHAIQSILIFLPISIIGWILIGPLGVSYSTGSVFGVPIRTPTLSPFYYVGVLIYVLGVILWLILMIKAYQGEKFKVPIVGDIAEKQIK